MAVRGNVARKEEYRIDNYLVQILFNADGKPIGAIVDGPRLRRPVYIAIQEHVKIKLPKKVKKLLREYGFNIE